MRSKWARRSGPRRRPGTHDAWAFGGTNSGGGSLPVGRPVAEHRASGKWRSSQLPSGLKGYISEVSAPSASDIWAITFLGGYILHWNGAHWSLSKHLTGAGELTGVTAFSAKNVWVFGGGRVHRRARHLALQRDIVDQAGRCQCRWPRARQRSVAQGHLGSRRIELAGQRDLPVQRLSLDSG